MFVSSFLLVCIVASAYLEGDRIITCSLRKQLQINERRVFDLNDFSQFTTTSDGKDAVNFDKNKEKSSATVDKNNKQQNNAANSTPTSAESVVSSVSSTLPNEHGSLAKRLVLLLVSLVTKRKLTRLSDMDGDDEKNNSIKALQRKLSADLGQPALDSSMAVAANKHRKGSGGGISTKTTVTVKNNNLSEQTQLHLQSKKSAKFAQKTQIHQQNSTKSNRKPNTPRPDDKENHHEFDKQPGYETSKVIVLSCYLY